MRLVRTVLENYKHYFPALFFAAGFVWDNLTLTRIDFWFDQTVLFSYLGIAGLSIILMNMISAGKMRWQFLARRGSWFLNITQFSFGALFSGYLVYYTRSGDVSAAWPFLVVLLLLFVGNEFFKSRYARFTFHISIYFIVLFSFLIFQLPIFIGSMGFLVFLLSGLIALMLIALFVWIVSLVAPRRIEESGTVLLRSIIGIYLAFNVLYISNVIPPIPLSLKQIGIYHSVERSMQGGYVVSAEETTVRDKIGFRDVIHHVPGSPLYCFAAVFAPTRLSTEVYHTWEYYSEAEGRWVTADRVRYNIAGGRDQGYRGYTAKANLSSGLWRCRVETGRGQVIGGKTFHVEAVLEDPDLKKEER